MSTIKVEGMKCAHCSGAIKDALDKNNAGTVEIDLEKGLVHWTSDLDVQEVKKIIESQGFSANVEWFTLGEGVD